MKNEFLLLEKTIFINLFLYKNLFFKIFDPKKKKKKKRRE